MTPCSLTGGIPRRALGLGAAALLAGGAEEMARSSGPPVGALLLAGGGALGPEIAAAALDLDGGSAARWVCVPTAAADEDVAQASVDNFVSGLGRRFAVLHTRDRAVADAAAFVEPLRDATAVWFEGGRQTRLMDAYAGTRTERALRAVLDRGGLMAGTSAGATIQGSHLVRGTRDSIFPPPGQARAFGYLHNVAIDQHVDARHRERDLLPLIAANPGLLGLGLDEGTAAVVRGDVFAVIGRGRVLVTDGTDHGGEPYQTLRAGDRYDLARWRRLP